MAQGAAYYGLVRRGLATRIKGGTARAFYIGVDTGDGRMAVCLAPPGLEEGARVQLERDFRLVTNRPVSFRLYSSSSRDDAPGALVPVGDGKPDTIRRRQRPLGAAADRHGAARAGPRIERRRHGAARGPHLGAGGARDLLRRSRAAGGGGGGGGAGDVEARVRHALGRRGAVAGGRAGRGAAPESGRGEGADPASVPHGREPRDADA